MLRWAKNSGVQFLLLCFLVFMSGCGLNTHVVDTSATSSPVIISEPDHATIISVAATDDVAYLAESDRSLTARQANNGQVVWRQTGLAFLPKQYVWLVPTPKMLFDAYDSTPTTAFVEARQINTGRVLWRRAIPHELGPGFVAVMVDVNRVYVNTVFPLNQGLLYALDADNGQVRWQYAFQGQPMDTSVYSSNGVVAIRDRASNGSAHVIHGTDGSLLLSYTCPAGTNWRPAIDSSNVYVYCPGHFLQAYRISDGKLVWTAQNSSLQVNYWIENQGVLYSNTGDELQAFRAQDGTLLWKTTLPGGTLGPSVQNQLVGMMTASQVVMVFHAKDGTLAWKRPLNSSVLYTDIDADGFFLFGNDQAIDVWRSSDGRDILHTTTSSRIVWQPQVVNAHLYLWQFNGALEVVDLRIGNVLWQYVL